MSIEAQLDRLNQNIESLVGAIAANTSVAASIANAGVNTTVAAPAAAEKPTRTRRTKEEIAAETAPAPVVPASQSGLTTAAPAAETPQAEEDPFGDNEPAAAEAPAYTLDDVRAAGVALKDVIGLEKARAFISTFGVDSIKDMPADKYAEFVTKANAETKKNSI